MNENTNTSRISANELRLGNWIQHEPYPEEKWKVDFGILESIDLELIECAGIPLTPEILGKCGFIKNGIRHESSDNPDQEYTSMSAFCFAIRLYRIPFSKYYCLFLEISNNELIGKSHYIHQLQNLYFALTGEELEVNLSHS